MEGREHAHLIGGMGQMVGSLRGLNSWLHYEDVDGVECLVALPPAKLDDARELWSGQCLLVLHVKVLGDGDAQIASKSHGVGGRLHGEIIASDHHIALWRAHVGGAKLEMTQVGEETLS